MHHHIRENQIFYALVLNEKQGNLGEGREIEESTTKSSLNWES